MKKTILVLAALLCSGLCAYAQDSNARSPLTVDGCLSHSGNDYVVKDKTSGESYTLLGNNGTLKKHVGHEVAIIGTISGGSSNSDVNASAERTSEGNASGLSTYGKLKVSSVKMVSSNCSQ
jgi:hypothetical protein